MDKPQRRRAGSERRANLDRPDGEPCDPAAVLLAHAPPGSRSQLVGGPELSAQLEELIASAHEQWPRTWLPCGVFFEFIAQRLPEEGDALSALGTMAIPDLYLACACVQGEESALRAFTEQCFPVVLAAVRRVARGVELAEDIQQIVFEKVFYRRGNQEPRIARYSGRGSLKNWIRMVAIRETQDYFRRHQREQPSMSAEVERCLLAEHDAEMAMLKRRYRKAFDLAFREAVASLTSRERNILRYHIVDGLELQTIARLYRVHRVTMSRWVRRIREQVIDHTRRELSRRLGASPEDVSSIMRVVRSRLDASISQYLVRSSSTSDPTGTPGA